MWQEKALRVALGRLWIQRLCQGPKPQHPDHESGPGRLKASYAGAVKGSQQASADLKTGNGCGSPISLEIIKPNVEDGRVRVKPPQGITAEGCSVWKNKHLGWIFCRSNATRLPGS